MLPWHFAISWSRDESKKQTVKIMRCQNLEKMFKIEVAVSFPCCGPSYAEFPHSFSLNMLYLWSIKMPRGNAISYTDHEREIKAKPGFNLMNDIL